MARKPKKELEEASEPAAVTPQSGGTTEIIDDSAKLVDPTPHTDRNAPPPERPPPPVVKVDRFTVVNGGKILHRGALTFMKPGKVVDGRSFNLDKLREQGILLELIKE